MVAPIGKRIIIVEKLPEIGEQIEWSNDFSVGIQEIDEQHKVLIGILNELSEAIDQIRGTEIRTQIIDRLIEYTRIHFTVEESLMRILGYPKYEEHKHEHELLISQINEFLTKINNENMSTYELLFFLRSWLINHILKSDKAYEQHFLNMGVKKNLVNRSWFAFWK